MAKTRRKPNAFIKKVVAYYKAHKKEGIKYSDAIKKVAQSYKRGGQGEEEDEHDGGNSQDKQDHSQDEHDGGNSQDKQNHSQDEHDGGNSQDKQNQQGGKRRRKSGKKAKKGSRRTRRR